MKPGRSARSFRNEAPKEGCQRGFHELWLSLLLAWAPACAPATWRKQSEFAPFRRWDRVEIAAAHHGAAGWPSPPMCIGLLAPSRALPHYLRNSIGSAHRWLRLAGLWRSSTAKDERTAKVAFVSTDWTMTVRQAATWLAVTLVALGWAPLAGVGQEKEPELRGAFAVTIADEDVPPELIGGASLIGRWQISFEGNGVYEIGRQDVGRLLRGQFETDGSRLILREETGVIACASGADVDVAAVYEWKVETGRLLLSAVEEPCASRRLLLTTRALSSFAACPPLSADRGEASAVDEPRRSNEFPGATPGQGTPVAGTVPTEEIDTLLKQMSDCWATRDPDRFLQLLSQEHRTSQAPVDDAGRRRYELNMAAPIVWDLTGEVETIDSERATAQVRQTLGDAIDMVQFSFVLEEGSWRWDGIVDSP